MLASMNLPTMGPNTSVVTLTKSLSLSLRSMDQLAMLTIGLAFNVRSVVGAGSNSPEGSMKHMGGKTPTPSFFFPVYSKGKNGLAEK